jgi:ABC-2 type transport system ATP-binding protein
MPQDLALYLDLTVMDNITLYGQLYGLDSKTLKERSANLLNLVGLTERKSALLSELSGGMKRKVSLVCALVHNPRLLILDEPTVGVDPTLRATLWNYFENFKEAGSTIIITTHYMDEAMHCDKVGFILDGKLIAEGTPDDILQSTLTSSLENAFLKLSAKEEVA